MNGDNVNRVSNSTNNRNNTNDFPDFDNFKSSFNTNTSEDSNQNSNGSNSNNENSGDNFNPFANLDMGTIMKMKGIMDKMNTKKDDPRSNLLLSLKPYLKSSRREKVDQYIGLFNMSSIFENFNIMGGEKNK